MKKTNSETSCGRCVLHVRAIIRNPSRFSFYAHGIGNEGRTLYDLANGATEYWTSGLGVGRNADTASQVYRSEMGSAADRKHEFITMLADDKTRPVMLSRGREAVRQAVLAN